jgi:hypothetical protein
MKEADGQADKHGLTILHYSFTALRAKKENKKLYCREERTGFASKTEQMIVQSEREIKSVCKMKTVQQETTE